jgi:hypothetical protein
MPHNKLMDADRCFAAAQHRQVMSSVSRKERKMRKIFIIGMISLLFMSCASVTFQKNLSKRDKVYTYIIDHTLSKEKSFERIDSWIAQNYKNAQKVIQLREKSDGAIVLKPVVSWIFGTTVICYSSYTLSIKTKDKKSRLVFELGTTTGSCYGPYPTVPAMESIKSEFEGIYLGIKKNLTMKNTALDDNF